MRVSCHNGSLLDSGCQLICHQVNEFGIMDGGLAKQIKEKYPNAFKQYSAEYAHIRRGGVMITEEKDTIVANCFSQRDWETDYVALASCVECIVEICKKYNIRTVGIPYKYGCGIANGNWDKVLDIWRSGMSVLEDVNLQIWRLDFNEQK